MSAIIPETHAEWRHCIEVDCGIALRPDYIAARLSVLRETKSQEVQRFSSLYGREHWLHTVGWFEQAQRDATRSVAHGI